MRPWSFEPHVAQLVLFQQQRLPSLADISRWEAHLGQVGYHTIRTGAVAAAAALRLEGAGYEVVQELVLLQHDHPEAVAARAPRGARGTRRVGAAEYPAASEVDCAAFAAGWRLDTEAVADVCHATPRHRARGVAAAAAAAAPGSPPDAFDAYAITGRDARQGFLQRLAVRPAVQGHGLGRMLVEDSLRWLARWRVQRVLVNTPADNAAALALYERTGFHRLGERLRVYERWLA